MTDQSKPMHEPTSNREARPQDGGTSGGNPKSPIPAKPTHGDPDRRSIGDENDRGLRQDTQSNDSDQSSDDSDESNERSGSSEQRGKPMQQANPSQKNDGSRKEGGERSAPGREGQAKQNDSQGERRAK